MEPVKQLKFDFDKEIISSVQTYLMSILNTNDIVYDVDGEVVGEMHSSSYCKTLRFVSARKDICFSYSWDLSKNAIRSNKSLEDQCSCGLTLIAVPICIHENTIIGAQCAAISDPYRSKFSVFDVASRFNVDAHILWDAVKKTPPVPKPILKIAREQVALSSELLSKIFTRIHILKQKF